MSWITQLLLLLGSLSMLLAAIGLLRFPDFYSRAHAGTKAASLGAGLILLGAILPIPDPDINIRVWLTILFIFHLFDSSNCWHYCSIQQSVTTKSSK